MRASRVAVGKRFLGILRRGFLREKERDEQRDAESRRRATSVVQLDYDVVFRSRWGYDAPPHERLFALLDARRDGYREVLGSFLPFAADLARIPLTAPPEEPESPSWINGFLPALDIVALYGFVAARAPETYLEIGSGNSTKVVRRAIRDRGLATRIVSIDPQPRAEVDALCDEVIRQALEEAPLATLPPLRAGDIVFLDGSHRVFPNSDVTVFFLELLPALPAGVLVGVHDIYLPWDYPPEILDRFYSEQYLLAARLLAPDPGLAPVLPAAFVSHHPDLLATAAPLWSAPGHEEVPAHGVAFWFVTE